MSNIYHQLARYDAPSHFDITAHLDNLFTGLPFHTEDAIVTLCYSLQAPLINVFTICVSAHIPVKRTPSL